MVGLPPGVRQCRYHSGSLLEEIQSLALESTEREGVLIDPIPVPQDIK